MRIMKKTIAPSIARITNNREKIDQPAASPPPASMVSRQVPQAINRVVRCMMIDLKVIADDLTVKVDAVHRHQDQAADSHDSIGHGHGRALWSQRKRPQCQKKAKQGADGDEDDMETFEGHDVVGLGWGNFSGRSRRNYQRSDRPWPEPLVRRGYKPCRGPSRRASRPPSSRD